MQLEAADRESRERQLAAGSLGLDAGEAKPLVTDDVGHAVEALHDPKATGSETDISPPHGQHLRTPRPRCRG